MSPWPFQGQIALFVGVGWFILFMIYVTSFTRREKGQPRDDQDEH